MRLITKKKLTENLENNGMGVTFAQNLVMPINRNALIRYKTIDSMLLGGRQALKAERVYQTFKI